MNQFQKVAIRSATGALIGLCLVILLVLIFFERRFIFDTIIILGTGGFIGGAISGGILTFVNNKIGVIIVAILGGIGGCGLAMFGTLLYTSMPWPSPDPYPNIEVEITRGAPGSWGLAQTQTYMANVSISELQRHYKTEMDKHCVTPWKFETLNDDENYIFCEQAECEIRRFSLEQYFEVEMCVRSEKHIVVTQVDFWED